MRTFRVVLGVTLVVLSAAILQADPQPSDRSLANAARVESESPYALGATLQDSCDSQLPGDANSDGTVTTSDLIFLVNFICKGGPAPNPLANGDVNGDCVIDEGDLSWIRLFFQLLGPPPVTCTCRNPALDIGLCYDTCSSQYPGDANSDGVLNVFDAIHLTNYLCVGGLAPDPKANGDPNGDCIIDSADVVYLMDHLFGAPSGPPPVICTCVDPATGPCGFGTLCANSYTDECVVACPAGDQAFHVYLRDPAGQPVAGESNVWLDFAGCAGVVPCVSEVDWPLVYPAGLSDADGRLAFYVNAGGCDEGCQVDVVADCGTIARVPFKSVDINGDLFVKLQDYDQSLCNDYNCDGQLDLADHVVFASHLFHNCASDPCDLISHEITIVPDTNLEVGDDVVARLTVENATTGTCTLDSAVFYESGFAIGSVPQPFALVPVGVSLGPGASTEVTAPYVIPGSGLGCVSARIYTSCCDSSTLAEHCIYVVRLICPPDTAFRFTYYVPTAPVYYKPTTSGMPFGFSATLTPGEGWLMAADSVMARVSIDSIASLGDSASVIMYFCTSASCDSVISRREFRVYFNQLRGDVNDDCTMTSADIIYLVNYVFKSGTAPLPVPENGNVNCQAGVSSADIIYLVNYIFKGGDPPLGACP